MSEILGASSPGPDALQVGMRVIGSDGEQVGSVKEVREKDFLLDRPMARDLFVPYQFILSVPDQWEMGPGEVVLTIGAGQLDEQHWQHA